MQPGITAGMTVEAKNVEPGTYQGRRGDIVVLVPPVSWPKGPGDVLVRRVIATGGETVACCDRAGRITVDGAPLDEPYVVTKAPLDLPGADCDGRRMEQVTVPLDQLFVMGDARPTVDSTCRGPVPASSVVGIVVS